MNDRHYRTTMASRVRRGLILNGSGAGLLAVLSGWQWYVGGHWLQAIVFLIAAPICLMAVFAFVRGRYPIEIFSDRIVMNSATKTSFPLSQVIGVGTHPKRGDPSLSIRDAATCRRQEVPILWSFIAEPQEEVVAKIDTAIRNLQR